MLRNSVTVSSNSFGVSSTLAPSLRISLRWMSISNGGKESCFCSSRRIGAAQQRVHAREQLLAPHRLHHVVVRAVLEREHDVLLGVAHRDEKHRHGLGDVGAQPHEHFGAGDVGHLPVEHEEIEALAAGLLHRLAPALVGVHVMAVVGDPALEQRQLIGIVF